MKVCKDVLLIICKILAFDGYATKACLINKFTAANPILIQMSSFQKAHKCFLNLYMRPKQSVSLTLFKCRCNTYDRNFKKVANGDAFYMRDIGYGVSSMLLQRQNNKIFGSLELNLEIEMKDDKFVIREFSDGKYISAWRICGIKLSNATLIIHVGQQEYPEDDLSRRFNTLARRLEAVKKMSFICKFLFFQKFSHFFSS